MRVCLYATSGRLKDKDYAPLREKIKTYAVIQDADPNESWREDEVELSIASDNVKRLIEDCMEHHEVILSRDYKTQDLCIEIYDDYRE